MDSSRKVADPYLDQLVKSGDLQSYNYEACNSPQFKTSWEKLTLTLPSGETLTILSRAIGIDGSSDLMIL